MEFKKGDLVRFKKHRSNRHTWKIISIREPHKHQVNCVLKRHDGLKETWWWGSRNPCIELA